jgi:putative pantetheine hydrolase
VGAGAGCRVAKASGTSEPGGLGNAFDEGVGAVVALNAYGSIRDPESGAWLTAPPPAELAPAFVQGNTTLAVVGVEHSLSKAQCSIVARMATAGLARTCYPAWSTVDGDTVFVVSTGRRGPLDPLQLGNLGHRAARVLERAVVNALEHRLD